MAQAMLAQEQALASLQTRVQELERQLQDRPSGGGFLSGIFGGGQQAAPPVRQAHPTGYPGQGYGSGYGSPWSRPAGGSFLAGAALLPASVAMVRPSAASSWSVR